MNDPLDDRCQSCGGSGIILQAAPDRGPAPRCSFCAGSGKRPLAPPPVIATMGRQAMERELTLLRARVQVDSFEFYEARAAAVAFYPSIGSNPVYPLLGLAGEVGEVAEKVKKVLRDRGGDFSDQETRKAILKELGDVLWYLTMEAREIGFSLGEVAMANLAKLEARAAKGTLSGSGDDR